MRRVLTIGAVAAMLAAAPSPAWAGPVTLNVTGIPAQLVYNVPFTITINYANPSSTSTVVNPHPYIYLYPSPNLVGELCSPGFKTTNAEVTVPYSAPIVETETTGGANNCKVRYAFSPTDDWNLAPGANSNWSQIRINVRPAEGVTMINLQVVVANPNDATSVYAVGDYKIPVAKTTATPSAEPTDVETPTPPPTTPSEPGPVPTSALVPKSSETDLTTLGVVLGLGLVVIGGLVFVLLLRSRRRSDDR